MKTSKPFSTISYNTADFLTVKLNELVRSRKIDFWAFIEHFAEEDELKPHKHLYIVPNGQIQTDSVGDYLLEVDATNVKPLGCIRFVSSKFGDWYLYAKHDIRYLASKGQARRYHYEKDDFFCSDIDYLTEEIHGIDMTKLNRSEALIQAVKDDIPFEDLLRKGQIPVQQVYAYQHAYELIRGNRETHTPKEYQRDNPEVNQDGEIIKPKLEEVTALPVEDIDF